jgi:hypothetical protein
MGDAVSDGFILKKDTGRDEMITRIVAFLELLPMDRAWEVTVKKYRKQRTLDQNSALWGVAYPPIMDATGYEKEELHEYYLGAFFGWTVKELFGQKKRIPNKRSSQLTTREFCDLYAFIQRHAAQELGVYVPDPDPMLKSFGQRRAA